MNKKRGYGSITILLIIISSFFISFPLGKAEFTISNYTFGVYNSEVLGYQRREQKIKNNMMEYDIEKKEKVSIINIIEGETSAEVSYDVYFNNTNDASFSSDEISEWTKNTELSYSGFFVNNLEKIIYLHYFIPNTITVSDIWITDITPYLQYFTFSTSEMFENENLYAYGDFVSITQYLNAKLINDDYVVSIDKDQENMFVNTYWNEGNYLYETQLTAIDSLGMEKIDYIIQLRITTRFDKNNKLYYYNNQYTYNKTVYLWNEMTLTWDLSDQEIIDNFLEKKLVYDTHPTQLEYMTRALTPIETNMNYNIIPFKPYIYNMSDNIQNYMYTKEQKYIFTEKEYEVPSFEKNNTQVLHVFVPYDDLKIDDVILDRGNFTLLLYNKLNTTEYLELEAYFLSPHENGIGTDIYLTTETEITFGESDINNYACSLYLIGSAEKIERNQKYEINKYTNITKEQENVVRFDISQYEYIGQDWMNNEVWIFKNNFTKITNNTLYSLLYQNYHFPIDLQLSDLITNDLLDIMISYENPEWKSDYYTNTTNFLFGMINNLILQNSYGQHNIEEFDHGIIIDTNYDENIPQIQKNITIYIILFDIFGPNTKVKLNYQYYINISLNDKHTLSKLNLNMKQNMTITDKLTDELILQTIEINTQEKTLIEIPSFNISYINLGLNVFVTLDPQNIEAYNIRILWGDTKTTNSYYNDIIFYNLTYMHSYDQSGEYVICVKLKNSHNIVVAVSEFSISISRIYLSPPLSSWIFDQNIEYVYKAKYNFHEDFKYIKINNTNINESVDTNGYKTYNIYANIFNWNENINKWEIEDTEILLFTFNEEYLYTHMNYPFFFFIPKNFTSEYILSFFKMMLIPELPFLTFDSVVITNHSINFNYFNTTFNTHIFSEFIWNDDCSLKLSNITLSDTNNASVQTIYYAEIPLKITTTNNTIYIKYGTTQNYLTFDILSTNGTYIIKQNNILLHTNNITNDNMRLNILLDNLSVGDYIYEIIVTDKFGRTCSKIIIVTVTEQTNDEDESQPTSPSIIPTIVYIVSIAGIIGVGIYIVIKILPTKTFCKIFPKNPKCI